ncbi:pheromone autoinducer 2 transporter [Saccharobesus litoralis]|uniref:Pheromone autoinducer 2 transporter n=1 Tax=Saccharobesus litoralis TaxID=2172099 RepID=A0A2S0VV66_9ALTE|nr:AI-2E family transporter [Saccharobesus litoralis]AWB68111.1 pheromone autoinducer 2 transporter [Saccharobesus litoralis]
MQFNSQFTAVSKLLLTVAAIIIIFAGVSGASAILEPFLLSVFVAITCQPLINYLAKFNIPKGIAVLLVVCMIVLVGMTLTGVVAQSMSKFSADIPVYKAQLQNEFTWLVETLAVYNIVLNKSFVLEHFDPSAAMSVATNTLSGLSNVLANFFLILLTSVFMLLEADSLKKKLHVAFDDPAMHIEKIDGFLESVKRYLAIKTVVSLGTGICASVLCWAVGVDYFILWGLLAFLLNYIPTIGSIIAAVPAILLALLQVGPGGAGMITVGYLAINTVMGNVVEPKYLGKGLGISTLVVFLSLVFWGWLLGTVGMLLSVPLTMVVKIALESNEETLWLALLISSGDELDEVVASTEASTEVLPPENANSHQDKIS